jgi:hypothetical protein
MRASRVFFVVALVVCGMLSVVFAVDLASGNTHNLLSFAIALLGTGIGLAGVLTSKKPQQSVEQLVVATRGYIEELEQSRTFAPLTVSNLHLEQGEFAIRHERATLVELTRARVGGGLGTRVRVGGIPIYLGGYKSVPNEELRAVGTGDLVLTNRRLLFLGSHTLTIPFNKLLTCQQMDAGLAVSETRSKRPHVFLPENPGLWCFLLNWVAKHRFDDPKLPDNMHLSVTGEGADLEVHVTGDAAS